MDTHESRLRAMQDPKSEGWGLNDEDRAAIKWAFDTMVSLKDQLDESRRMHSDAILRSEDYRKRVEAAVIGLVRIGTGVSRGE